MKEVKHKGNSNGHHARFIWWLASRFYLSKGTEERKGGGATSTAVSIATIGVALGLTVMLVSIAVVKGFQYEVGTKFTGVASHITLLNDSALASPESFPVRTDSALLHDIRCITEVEHVDCVSEKIGVLKTDEVYQSVMLKGIAQDYSTEFLQKHLIEGVLPNFTDSQSSGKVVLSELQAKRMEVGVGDKIYAYFFEDRIKARRYEVVGIYRTFLPQVDKHVVYTDKYTVNKLNGWDNDLSSSVGIKLHDMDDIDAVQTKLSQLLRRYQGENRHYSHWSVKEHPHTASAFSWLEVLDVNVWAILIIMMGVACFTIVSGLLILILERASTIGLLKALGMNNDRLRSTFVAYATFIVGRGLFWGNIVAFVLLWTQQTFGWMKLDPENYYVATVPVAFDFWWIIGINGITLLLTVLSMVVPSVLITRIDPAKALQKE